jgi:GNAT superfamily N-acetyltransferase
MNLRLAEIAAAQYSRQVLPLTEPLWANGRSFEAYVAQTEEIAHSAYGRRAYRTLALTDGNSGILASFKRYEREARLGKQLLRAIGIGAVFTPEEQRGKGYASAMLGLALDEARAAGFDFAYLFSDIHPQFYKELGFAELPSRSISLRADALSGERADAEPLTERDWPGVRHCFDAMEAHRTFALLRAPMVWNWIRLRLRHGSEHPKGQPVHLAARRAKSVVAYVIGQREPKHDAFIVDEVAYASESHAQLVPALLRSGAGDLRRVVGWLPPAPVRALLPRGSVRRRSDAVWMIAPLSAGGTAFLEAAKASGSADGVWSLDHI